MDNNQCHKCGKALEGKSECDCEPLELPAPERNLRLAGAGNEEERRTPQKDKTEEKEEGREEEKKEELKEEKREEKKEEKKEEKQQPRGADNKPKALTDQFFKQYVRVKGDKNHVGQVVNQHERSSGALKEVADQSYDMNVTASGGGGIFGNNVYINNPRPEEPTPGGAAVESLIDITAALSSKPDDTPDFESDELGRYAALLRAERVLLLSCADEKVALGAAYALMDEAGIANDCRRSLDFQSNAQSKYEQIGELLSRRTDKKRAQTAIVVGAYSNGSSTFRDWLGQVDHLASQRIRGDLRDNRFVLICLVEAAYMERAEKDLRAEGQRLNFLCWKINFLRPLLKHHFSERSAEFEERLVRQRAEGKWKSDETRFCQEVRDCVEADRLPEEIKARQQGDSPAPAVPSFGGGRSVEDAVLYTAAYFPDLTLREFDQIVGLLLAGKTKTVTVRTVRTNKDGEPEPFDTEVQKPLAEFWDESPDEYLDACQLEADSRSAVSRSEATMTVNFSNGKVGDELRRVLGTKHRMYVLRQFQAVEACGLLFHTSPRVSAGMMQLCVEMALSHPDVVGRDWLYKMVTTIGQVGNDGTPGLRLPPGLARPEAYAYERVAQLIRQLLKEPRLEELAGSLLLQLMDTGKHKALLELIRGLQFAPKIKEFGWIKRVLDEGREEARAAARGLLYGYIKKVGLYSLLKALEGWLPRPEQPPDECAPSGLAALRVVAEYCWETRRGFDPSAYGAWPSRHPLFAFEDAAAAEDGLRRLFRWMFHPAMQSALDELDLAATVGLDYDPTTFASEFLVEWVFVLQGLGETGAKPPGAPEARLTAAAMREMMLEQAVKAADRAQRDEMLTYWEEVRDFLGFVLDRRGYLEYVLDRHEQQAVRWKRELVRGLIKQFRELSWRHRASAQAARAVEIEQGVSSASS